MSLKQSESVLQPLFPNGKDTPSCKFVVSKNEQALSINALPQLILLDQQSVYLNASQTIRIGVAAISWKQDVPSFKFVVSKMNTV